QVDVGSLYVNDFNRFGRTWQVNVQAAEKYRDTVNDVTKLKGKSDRGRMVPLGSVAQVQDKQGPVMVMRYNMYPAAVVTGRPGPGVSSGQGIRHMEDVSAPALDPSMRMEWTELAALQLATGNA